MSVIQLIIDEAIIEDYIASFTENYTIVNNCVGMLDKDPTDEDVINEVFRALHTIKGNADMCQFDSIAHFTHELEDLVTDIRDGRLIYQPLIGEILLLCLDKIKEVSQLFFTGDNVDQVQLNLVQQELEKISQKDASLEDISNTIVDLISGHIIDQSHEKIIADESPSQFTGLFSDTPSTNIKTLEILPCPYNGQALCEDDKDFLRGLKAWTSLMEQKIPHWRGRLERTLPMAMEINSQLPDPIDTHQLEAAIYVHDVSFAFLGNHLLQQDSKFDKKDIEEMQQHPLLSANLLKHIQGWDTAATIVLQHHEKWDGSGYPNHLKQDQIHVGAQILAIVDTYESVTSLRPDRQFKRSVLRAVTEINNCTGSQFNPDIVLLFNTIIREKMKQR